MIGHERPNSSARSRRGCEKPAPETIVLHVRATGLSPVCEVDAEGGLVCRIVWLPPGRKALTP
jgi:hypothetical protein